MEIVLNLLLVIIFVISWIVTLIIAYHLIKAAVRNGVSEANNRTGDRQYQATMRLDKHLAQIASLLTDLKAIFWVQGKATSAVVEDVGSVEAMLAREAPEKPAAPSDVSVTPLTALAEKLALERKPKERE